MQKNELDNYLINHKLFELFKKQILKDFEMAGIQLDEVLLPNFNDLVLKLKNLLLKNKFEALLYRIDISEEQIKNYCSKNEIDFLTAVSELIIKRELQKVIFKINYK
ncbi:MAG: hypothetical protein LCH32_11315 [Bacteroidetes bacterium]|nr:hypothetical protein [Bacteroidota bacterium]